MSSGGHKTSAIPRPKDPTRAATRAAQRPGNDDTRFADFTRPIPREKQLVRGRTKRGVIALAATVITAALVAALFVLPVQAWLRQDYRLDERSARNLVEHVQRQLDAVGVISSDTTFVVESFENEAGDPHLVLSLIHI